MAARGLGPKLTAALLVNVLIDNKPGAGGSLGAGEVAKAEPDGNALLMGHIGTLAVDPAMYPKLSYDPLTSFVPVAYVARVPNVLVVPAASPAITFKEFIDRARSQPGGADRAAQRRGGPGLRDRLPTAQQVDLAGTPADVVDRPDQLGMRPSACTPAELRALLAGETRRWDEVIQRAKIEPQ